MTKYEGLVSAAIGMGERPRNPDDPDDGRMLAEPDFVVEPTRVYDDRDKTVAEAVARTIDNAAVSKAPRGAKRDGVIARLIKTPTSTWAFRLLDES